MSSPARPTDWRSVIEFRRGTYPLPWAPENHVQTIEVVIDGVSLSERFAEVGSSGYAILADEEVATDLGIWGPGPVEEWDAPEGFVPVLTCGCTVYGCGGSYARITYKADTVQWSDFHNQGSGKPVAVGPFFFDRGQYEQARKVFSTW